MRPRNTARFSVRRYTSLKDLEEKEPDCCSVCWDSFLTFFKTKPVVKRAPDEYDQVMLALEQPENKFNR